MSKIILENNKIYLVELTVDSGQESEYTTVEGIFSSREKAKAFIQEWKDNIEYIVGEGTKIEEAEEDSLTFDDGYCSDCYLYVAEYTVDEECLIKDELAKC